MKQVSVQLDITYIGTLSSVVKELATAAINTPSSPVSLSFPSLKSLMLQTLFSLFMAAATFCCSWASLLGFSFPLVAIKRLKF